VRRGPDQAGRAGSTALLLIDVVNAFAFEGSEPLVRAARRVAPSIERLAVRARSRNVPVIYVNDNFGQWRSDFQATVAACTRPTEPGHDVAARLRPQAGDYFVLKPLHSGFHGTPLELLLGHLSISNLLLVGFATNLCVLFTANDAHMLGYRLFVPSDCTASNSSTLTRSALQHVEVALGGDTRQERYIDFRRGVAAARRGLPRGANVRASEPVHPGRPPFSAG
jgi:nicotinamidase-related amidase